MTTYKQGDYRWGWKKLGTSGLTMARAGCTVTDIAFSWTRFTNVRHTPGELCDKLNKNGGFTAQGYLRWDKAAQITGLKLLGAWRRDGSGHLYYNGQFDPPTGKKYTLVQVHIYKARLDHWIALTGQGKAFDPLDGTIKTITQPYWRLTGEKRYLG